MIAQPAYFEQIRKRSAERWKQLESDPELAAPWWQLFKQVQSPRHIFSELLQNADDAGATNASVSIEDNIFLFEHNGEDFTEEHFASLCKFGYSNKRALHTIGFRGIGFKSTFSLGKRVELITPSLSVAFEERRFTEPKWESPIGKDRKLTAVRVAIEGSHRRKEVEKNLEDWLKSPVSLLFFKNIRRIRIGKQEVHWGSLGPGPSENSEWMALHDNPERVHLLVRSQPEAFPEEALAEIREERLLPPGEQTTFPPCSIDLVLGAEGRLFVVLPTGVKTTLPFSCNAPFIQDPARLKIKDPEISPTNRWLLDRAGRLAAHAMLGWLVKPNLDPTERASAYDLMPDVDREASSLEGVCGAIVETSFAEVLDGKKFLICEDGKLVAHERCISVPVAILETWPGGQARELFDEEGKPFLSSTISDANRLKLVNWGHVTAISDDDVLNALQGTHPPKPKTWHQLLALWAYLAPLVSGYGRHQIRNESLCVVPAQAKQVLYSADEIVRLGEKKLVPSEDDWRFLGERLSALNQNWLRYLTERKRIAEQEGNEELTEKVQAAEEVLEALSLENPSDTGKVIDRVAAEFFAADEVPLEDAVRLAQIAAKLGATAGGAFQYVCADDHFCSVTQNILIDLDGYLEFLLPEKWAETRLLHPDYLKRFSSCTREEWRQWVASGRANLHTFVPLNERRQGYLSQSNLVKELKLRQFGGSFEPRYKNPWFHIDDWDFPDEVWARWEELVAEDSALWGKVVEAILSDPRRFWSSSVTATVVEEASNGHTRRVIRQGLVPRWVLKLRNKNCLRDTHGAYRKPSELLRRTPETEPLIDVELFVHARLDTPHVSVLLSLLGVGENPASAEKLLNRVRALSKLTTPPAYEVEKWYRRLDQLIDECATQDADAIKAAFKSERLILTESGAWETVAGVFLSVNEEDAPGAEIVRSSARDLTLWAKVGVEYRPNSDLAIKWLERLPTGPLVQEDIRRVRALLARYPLRVWQECKHWLNLAGEWIPIQELQYALTMQSLIPWGHLHPWVKSKTANLQDLPIDVINSASFAQIPLLSAQVEERFHRKGLASDIREERRWLTQLGLELQRIELKDESEALRIRGLGGDLANTKWQTTSDLEVISYIDGKPAGTPRRVDTIWVDRTLHAENKPLALLARTVASELGRAFRNAEIVDAIKMCFERSIEFVTAYMEGHFTLGPPASPQNANVAEEAAPQVPSVADAREQEVLRSEGDSETRDSEAAEPDEDTTDTDETENGGDIPDNPDAPGSPIIINPRVRRNDPPKLTLMERFALSHGYKKDRDGDFFDAQGNRIGRANGELFPWQLRSRSGEIARYYWPKDHCLERAPLELEAEVWSIIEKSPGTYVLVLAAPDGKPIEVGREKLRAMQEGGTLTLHPATYRLVFRDNENV